WAPLADALEREHGYQVVLLGGPGAGERRIADATAAAARTEPIPALTSSVRTMMGRVDGVDLLISPDTGPLHLAHALGTPVFGRGPVPVLATPRGRWVVRRYHRGGRVAALLRDRYLRWGSSRPLREAHVSGELLRRGIPTPRVVAGAIYPDGAFYRADLMTEF